MYPLAGILTDNFLEVTLGFGILRVSIISPICGQRQSFQLMRSLFCNLNNSSRLAKRLEDTRLKARNGICVIKLLIHFKSVSIK